ncbi:hypothetical protein Daus18300_006859 [Diaporthe australafricana]|uniref:RING-type domain-containing protein n=1 Tax=Diaporthe australafricana TaxID=127596 RepID=A0ABR3WRJ5_9PEZI
MAAAYVTVTPALAELISSLPQDEVPIKLRCAICSKLAVNAFRTPCCEQMICENCKLALRSTCPVCEHTPMSADDCKPNKALRMTTKAFLKTAEKKRDISQVKESTPVTPVDAKVAPTPTAPDDKPSVDDGNPDAAAAPATQGTQQEGEQSAQVDDLSTEQNAAPETTETNVDRTSATENEIEPSGEQVSGEVENPEDVKTEEQNESNEDKGDAEAAPEEADGDEDNKDNSQQNPSYPNGFGGMNGSFPNMNFGGDFNQMQMMMAMQNGMAPNFGGFPMMGMPGMGMDPSMMNMYQMSNGFGPGMDMSMMNGNMGGFNGSMGADGNWNGPQTWNNGQNNYNHPNASGMGNGDYGDFNSGYQTGYNQGNFGPHNQFNAYRGRGFYRGGRGFRGRGNFNNFGRGGGFGYGQQGNYQGQNYMNQQDGSNMMDKDANGPQPLPNVSSGEGEGDKSVDEFGRTIRPEASQDGVQDADKTESVTENGDGNTKSEASGAGPDNAAGPGQPINTDQAGPGGGGGDPTFAPPNGNFVPADLSIRPGSGTPFGGHHPRGGSFGVMPPPAAPVPDVPLNAPKGPKAMRQGLPNTSLLNLRARGYQIPGGENFNRVQSPSTPANGVATPVDDEREQHKSRSSSPRKGDSEHHRERSTSRSRGSRDQERDRSRHRDRHGKDRDRSESAAAPSRSRSGERRDRKRKSRRNHSDSDGERDYDRERRHRHRSSKKHHDEDEEPKSRSSRDEKYADRSRSASPTGSRKASHRSSRKERDSEKRRDRDRDREKERDRERDHSDDDRDHKRKSSHRPSHRDRDRDHDRSDRSDRDRDREKDKDRERRRERDRDRDKEREKERERRHSKRSTAEPPTPTEPAEDVKPFNPPTGPRGSISKNFSIFNAPKGYEIKGAFAKTSTSTSSSSTKQPPSGPAADRDRDREKGKDSRRSSSASTSKPAGLDPHAAERERRNRERLLKETQRLAQFTGLKRRNTEDAAGGSDSKRSRHRRGGQVVDEDDEARLRKSEAEREESRWE